MRYSLVTAWKQEGGMWQTFGLPCVTLPVEDEEAEMKLKERCSLAVLSFPCLIFNRTACNGPVIDLAYSVVRPLSFT